MADNMTIIKPAVKAEDLTQCNEGDMYYFKDFKTGRCFTNRDMKVEINEKTLKPLV